MLFYRKTDRGKDDKQMKTKERVYAILRELSHTEALREEDGLQSDLGLDSLLMVTLLVELEEALQIELDESVCSCNGRGRCPPRRKIRR